MAITAQQQDMLKAAFILAALLAVLAGVFEQVYVKDQLVTLEKKISAAQTQNKALNDQIRNYETALANKEELKRKRELLEKLARKLPSREDAPGFYQALVNIIELTRIDYTKLEQLKPASRGVYTEIPYRITCIGRYHDFGQFMNLVEENRDRFMRVKKFKINNLDTRPSIHPIVVELGTFMFNTKG